MDKQGIPRTLWYLFLGMVAVYGVSLVLLAPETFLLVLGALLIVVALAVAALVAYLQKRGVIWTDDAGKTDARRHLQDLALLFSSILPLVIAGLLTSRGILPAWVGVLSFIAWVIVAIFGYGRLKRWIRAL